LGLLKTKKNKTKKRSKASIQASICIKRNTTGFVPKDPLFNTQVAETVGLPTKGATLICLRQFGGD
jgi:hypothetical protein